MRRLLLFGLCLALAFPVAAQTTTRPWIGKNASLKTVCSSSACDYQTIQAALDGTTGSATQPVTILVMPGRYSECLTVAHDDDYKSLVSLVPRAAEVYCANATTSVSALDFNLSAATTDLDGFEVVGLKFNRPVAEANNIEFTAPLGSSAVNPTYARADLTFREIECVEGDSCLQMTASDHDDPPRRHSELRLENVLLKPQGLAVLLQNPWIVSSVGTTVRALDQDSADEHKCWSDHGSGGIWRGSAITAVGDDCEIAGSLNLDLDPTCAICLYYGENRMSFSGGTYYIRSGSAASTYGARGIMLGTLVANGNGGQGRLLVKNSTFYLDSQSATGAAYGVVASQLARIRLKGVTFYSSGLDAMTDAVSRADTYASSFIKYTGTNISSTSVLGAGTISEAP